MSKVYSESDHMLGDQGGLRAELALALFQIMDELAMGEKSWTAQHFFYSLPSTYLVFPTVE